MEQTATGQQIDVSEVWTPQQFTKKCNDAGLTNTQEIGKEANLIQATIAAMEAGSRTINDREAKQVAPIIGMDPVAFRVSHNAYVLAASYELGGINLFDVHGDYLAMDHALSERNLKEADETVAKTTLELLAQPLVRDIKPRLENTKLWPQIATSWIAESPLLSRIPDFNPATVGTRAG